MNAKIIAAVSINGTIGNDNEMLWHVPEDFKRYKKRTTGNILIVGRKTYEGLPTGALKNRTHIVVQRDPKRIIDVPNDESINVVTAYSPKEALDKAASMKGEDQEIFVIGGTEIYNQFIDLVDEAEITWINKIYPSANKTFPINKLFEKFECTGDSNWVKSEKGLMYKFTYYNKND